VGVRCEMWLTVRCEIEIESEIWLTERFELSTTRERAFDSNLFLDAAGCEECRLVCRRIAIALRYCKVPEVL